MSGSQRLKDTDEHIRADALLDAFMPSFSPTIGLDAVHRWTEMNKELARFYSQRLKTDLKTLTECAGCKKPGDISAVWFKATNTAVRDYTDEFGRLMAMNLPDGH